MLCSTALATHGTHEFFQWKHRLLEFLNVEMGFTILAVETDMASAYPLGAYIRSAANGHVSTAKYGSFEPMGLHLRRIYGDQLVVFGFSFNRGSFQAYERTKGLKVFTVPPPPAGSLDATLAATGIPMFVLDLRRVPRTSPVAGWLATPRQTRSIGGVYVEDAPYQHLAALDIPNSFDVLLFVENTTAVRKVE